MSASTVIGDVTQSLEDLLKTEQRPANFFDVSLKSPAEETIDQSTTKPKINLFLMRVLENPHAKNQDWAPVGVGELQYPPLALDLLYLLTPFSSSKLDEHRVLGEAMRVFYDHSIVTGSFLLGSLAGTTEELKLDLRPCDLEELTKVWNAFNKPYRLSVCYDVRMVFIDSATRQQVTRVIEKTGIYSQI
ncbi:MAG: DUF4255 domain-containing protein [Acidobacteria bacterium]|nr:MAG: DUF4255 domain-containing protein [Acidobacteriota bacterium]RPJ63047.1 MAG: DUF4255 domain-containing protein [Acidobacteriota bacterium]